MSVHKMNVRGALDRIWWPIARLGEAVETASCRSGLRARPASQPLMGPPWFKSGDIADWLDWAGDQLGVEAISVDVAIAELHGFLIAGGPSIILHQRNEAQGFLVLQAARKGVPQFLAPDHALVPCRAESIISVLCADRARILVPEMERVLAAAGMQGKRHDEVLSAMLGERLSSERVDGIWQLRIPAEASFWQQLRHAGVPRKLALALAIFGLLYGGEILGWKLIGSAAIGGRLDFGWLAAWVLLVMTMIPWRVMGGWFEAAFALDAGRILKSRLLAGALVMAPDAVKRSGIGHLVSRVMESQALESLVLNGGIAVAVSVMELGFAAWILDQGAAGATHLLLLAGWSLLTVWLAWRYHRKLRAWSISRLDLTHGLIESMVGHRTRLAQERADRRNAGEDGALLSYLDASRGLDRTGVFAFSALPSGWMLAGLAGLIPALAAATTPTPASLAISIGGMLVAQRAFSGIASGLAGLSRAWFAWGQVSTLFHAAGDSSGDRPFLPEAQLQGADARKSRLVDAQGLSFRYGKGEERVIDRADIIINRGDRILVEGPSGGGKSTLAACLTGLLEPESGLLLLNGLDRHTLGGNWNRLVTAAPQFHDNHILSGTIGFNLLMGRQWPASKADLAEAESLCRELGLGDLLERMPGGMQQRVGETGWQLSHGERSRIFLARALLQRAPLTIMDESFASLDPETMEKCLDCALRRAETLIVIAHP